MQEDQADLTARYQAVLRHIRELSQHHQRPADSVRLLAVSKGQGIEAIAALFRAGQVDFGENYEQELLAKAEALRHLPIRWHFIGHLQSNKIRSLVSVASSISTVGSLRHATLLARAVEAHGKAPFPIFIEVNAEAEASKSGCRMDEVLPLARQIAHDLPALDVQGLFAIPKALAKNRSSTFAVPSVYTSLRELAKQTGHGLLSLGMSDDMPEAIAAGTDYVRVGTAIFGPRANKAATASIT